MSMVEVDVYLKHDSGTIRIRTVASSVDAAIEKVLLSECAPHSAIVEVRARNLKKQES